MTQDELGQRLAPLLGKPWSRSTVSVAEHGGRAFTAAELVAIANVLQTRTPRLLTPPIEVAEVEMPGGVRLPTRGIADIGIADTYLSAMWDDLADAKSSQARSGAALNALEDKLATAIGVAEVATMHSDREARR